MKFSMRNIGDKGQVSPEDAQKLESLTNAFYEVVFEEKINMKIRWMFGASILLTEAHNRHATIEDLKEAFQDLLLGYCDIKKMDINNEQPHADFS